MVRILTISLALLMLGIVGAGAERPHDREKPAATQPVADSCRPGAWRNVSPDIVAQAAELIKQFNAAKDQLAKLGVAGSESVMVVRPERTGYISPRGAVYEGNWGEVREALQGMLSRRLSGLACRLQALGVDMFKST